MNRWFDFDDTYIWININENLTQGQDHKVKNQGEIYNYEKKIFGCKPWIGNLILIILLHMINING